MRTLVLIGVGWVLVSLVVGVGVGKWLKAASEGWDS